MLSPLTWIDCTVKVETADFPLSININCNGAGDAFLSGLLVAAMLRYTGLSLPSSQYIALNPRDMSLLTKYEVVSFSLCKKKVMLVPEDETNNDNIIITKFNNVKEVGSLMHKSQHYTEVDNQSNIPMLERTEKYTLNLEIAAKFASLVARRHIDVSTRDLKYLDIRPLLEYSILSPHFIMKINN